MPATAAGDRSVAVGGDIVDSVIVTGDNVQIRVGAGGIGGTLLYLLGWRRRVKKRARPTPLDVRPAPFDDRFDREAEVAALAAGGTARLSVVGEAFVGKTYVVRAALAEAAARAPRDGIVCVRGRGRALGDLLQELWQEFYDTRPPTLPSARELREDLAELEALVVVDDAELEHGDAQALADVLPRSRFILVSRERQLWDGGELPITGLSPDAGFGMFERDLGRPLAVDERQAAAAVYTAVGGHPQRLRQAAGIVARGAHTVEQLAAALNDGADLARVAIAATTERERDVLAALEPFGNGPVAAAHIETLAGPGGGNSAEALVRLGIAVSQSPSYSLAVELGVALDDDRLERSRARAVDHIARLAETHPREFGDDLPAALALLRRTADLKRWRDVLRLGRALAPALVLARRFEAWGETVHLVQAAARHLDDLGALAWALHEQGTRALCRGDAGGTAILQEALELRERIGDGPGAAATRHNLQLPAAAPWYLRRIAHLPVIALLTALVAIVAVGGATLWPDDEPAPGQQHALRIAVVGDGTVAAGSAEPCSESCERSFGADEQIELGATPASSWRFTGWSGDCSGSDCTLRLDADRSVTATFAGRGAGHSLSVELAEGGTIASEPAGIACPTVCRRTFDDSSVALAARADDGWRLTGWGAAGCEPPGDCTVDLTADVTVRPVFVRLVTLDIVVEDGGSISFADESGATLVCPVDCSADYPPGATVQLSASPDDGYGDPDWHRAGCDPRGRECTFKFHADTTVSPVFPRVVALEISLAGDGSGTVSGRDPTFLCESVTCSQVVDLGSTIALSAGNGAGSDFEAWEGEDAEHCGESRDCVIVVDESPAVTAVFSLRPEVSVTVNGPVGSRVVSSPQGIDCDLTDEAETTVTCSAAFPAGTRVVLSPVEASTGAYLASWAGACEGNGSCSVLLGRGDAVGVTANFALPPG